MIHGIAKISHSCQFFSHARLFTERLGIPA
jgi:hypothetical protein